MSFDELIRQVAAEHHRELTDQAIAHATEVGRLKAKVLADGECLTSMRQQASAWVAVCAALNAAVPGWNHAAGRAVDHAVAAIEGMAARICDLEHQIRSRGLIVLPTESDPAAAAVTACEPDPAPAYTPDWSKAPEGSVAWAVDEDQTAWFYLGVPEVIPETRAFYSDKGRPFGDGRDFDYDGSITDWRNSLQVCPGYLAGIAHATGIDSEGGAHD